MKILYCSILIALSVLSGSIKCNPFKAGKISTDKDSIAAEMRTVLDTMFAKWYPLAVDKQAGGYFSDINYKWELEGSQNKMIVTQARHIWSISNAALLYNRKDLLLYASHGTEFLKNIMWDKQSGGFYDLVSRYGEVYKDDGDIVKKAYGNSFAIYGLSAYFRATGDTAAFNLAKETFTWLDQHSYDAKYGGYFQFISKEGKPYTDGYQDTPPKDQNSSIHLLESFTELYKVWKDENLKIRLTSLLNIIVNKIVTDSGYMRLFFSRDWTPFSLNASSNSDIENFEYDHVSFGHDIEIAYLILEAYQELDIKPDANTMQRIKKLVDHSIDNGWDKEFGGLYDRGYYFKDKSGITIIRKSKEWWSQAEGLNTLLVMSEMYPDDKQNYYNRFCEMWHYIKTYVIDQKYGDWYWGGIDRDPNTKYSPKSSIWKCNYHTSRSLINCLTNLHH